MKKLLSFLAAVALIALLVTHPLGKGLMAWTNNQTQQLGYSLAAVPGPNNGNFGEFTLPQGRHRVEAFFFADVCHYFKDSAQPQVLAIEHRNGNSYTLSQWSALGFSDQDIGAIDYHVVANGTVVRHSC